MKTDLTLKLEREIWLTTVKQGVFGCYEVTIGQYGRERVDFMTMDTKGIFRCYEIKISKSDFHSSAAQTFCGHYNYFVMPQALYEQVRTEIPKDIGVFCEARFRDGTAYEQAPCVCVKRAQRRELTVSVDVLKDSLIRSLSRDVGKQVHSGSPTLVELYIWPSITESSVIYCVGSTSICTRSSLRPMGNSGRAAPEKILQTAFDASQTNVRFQLRRWVIKCKR